MPEPQAWKREADATGSGCQQLSAEPTACLWPEGAHSSSSILVASSYVAMGQCESPRAVVTSTINGQTRALPGGSGAGWSPSFLLTPLRGCRGRLLRGRTDPWRPRQTWRAWGLDFSERWCISQRSLRKLNNAGFLPPHSPGVGRCGRWGEGSESHGLGRSFLRGSVSPLVGPCLEEPLAWLLELAARATRKIQEPGPPSGRLSNSIHDQTLRQLGPVLPMGGCRFTSVSGDKEDRDTARRKEALCATLRLVTP
ncbi:PREDICTED: uncharacterized protein LOC105533822 [Mandrillus leucophaeus]|uniref:uncharacterized protein LOC105533822 n=1 Tax=Mandrillus leucophaeus TaxID=9568 RepID=UPI0005F3833E|nr:PREDICTED: uncharacterized protein LOC105533822 [Mandrillus leucophaeus]